jgi:hypothetical protein
MRHMGDATALGVRHAISCCGHGDHCLMLLKIVREVLL